MSGEPWKAPYVNRLPTIDRLNVGVMPGLEASRRWHLEDSIRVTITIAMEYLILIVLTHTMRIYFRYEMPDKGFVETPVG